MHQERRPPFAAVCVTSTTDADRSRDHVVPLLVTSRVPRSIVGRKCAAHLWLGRTPCRISLPMRLISVRSDEPLVHGRDHVDARHQPGCQSRDFSVVDAMLVKAVPTRSPTDSCCLGRHLPPGMSLGYSEVPWGDSKWRRSQSRPRTFEHIGASKSAQFHLGDGVEVWTTSARLPDSSVRLLRPRCWPRLRHRGRSRWSRYVVVLGYAVGNAGSMETATSSTYRPPQCEPYTVLGVMPRGFAFPHGRTCPRVLSSPRTSRRGWPLALPTTPRRGLSETRCHRTIDVRHYVLRRRWHSTTAAARGRDPVSSIERLVQ